MKGKNLLLLTLSLVGLLACVSCRKTDAPQKQEEPIAASVEDKFFNSHRTDDPAEKNLVDFLKRQNEKRHFVEKTATQIGFPRWDKALTKGGLRANGRTASDSATLIYIPFVRDSQSYVNASMVIKASSSDTSFSYLCDWQYSNRQNSATAINDSAEYFAVFFMVLDKSVFGYNKFDLTDTTLFKGNNRKPVCIKLKDAANADGRTTLSEVVKCQDVTIYFEDCTYQGNPACTPTCDHCPLCMGSISYQYCWSEYVGTGGGGGGSTGGGGGGSGGSGSGDGTPPNCDGLPVARAMRTQCAAGWEPSGGGSGVGTATHPTVSVLSVNTDSLSNPCLKGVVELIGASGHQSFLSGLYHQFFGSGNDAFKIAYKQDTALTGASGNPVAAHSDPDTLANGTVQWTITLNPNLLKNASKEYIATVVFHELTHAYISFRFPANNTLTQQHQFIFDRWVPSIARAVKELYPGQQDSDYVAMALQGLEDVTIIQTGPNTGQVNQTNNQYSITNYQMDVITSRTIALPFFNGTSGTHC